MSHKYPCFHVNIRAGLQAGFHEMKKIFIVASLGVLILAIVALALYNKPHREVGASEGIVISAVELFEAFVADEASANEAYLDNVLSVTGIVNSVQANQQGDQVLVLETNDLMFGVSCTMESPVTVVEGREVTIKGFCKGYLSDVVLTNCILE